MVVVEVPFTWGSAGWLIGRSAELPTAEGRPLRDFGDDLAAYRDELHEVPPTGREAAR